MIDCRGCPKKFEKKWWNQMFCDKECRARFYLRLKVYPPCVVCGFDLVVESHHIVPKFLGGSDDKKNKAFLCPNHHRMVHNEKYREDIERLIRNYKNPLLLS